jgi:hypothetical protein
MVRGSQFEKWRLSNASSFSSGNESTSDKTLESVRGRHRYRGPQRHLSSLARQAVPELQKSRGTFHRKKENEETNKRRGLN